MRGRLFKVDAQPPALLGLRADDGRLHVVTRGVQLNLRGDLPRAQSRFGPVLNDVLDSLGRRTVPEQLRFLIRKQIEKQGTDPIGHHDLAQKLVQRGLLRPVDVRITANGLWLISRCPSGGAGAVDPLLAELMLATGTPPLPFARHGELGFSWSSTGPVPGFRNVQIGECDDPHTWQDNFLIPYGADAAGAQFVWQGASTDRLSGYQSVW